MTSAFFQLPPIARALQTMNTVRLRNKDDICATDEKSAFNDSNHSPNPLFQPRSISDWAKAAVENAVTAVSDERLARWGLAKPCGGTDRFHRSLSCLHANGDNLYR